MTNAQTKEKLWDGSLRVFTLERHDGETHDLPNPVEYEARCLQLGDNAAKDWRGKADAWVITINGVPFDYYTGVGLREKGKPKRPELADVLCSLVLDAEAADMPFDDWCDDFGCNSDSIKDRDLYMQCQDVCLQLRKAKITRSDALQEFLREF